MYSHSLIFTQLRFPNLSVNRPLDEAWGLPPLSTIVGGEVKKSVGRNWPPLLVKKTSASSLDSQGSG